MRVGGLAVLAAVATASCASNTTPPAPGNSQNPPAQRLAWSQVAVSQTLIERYDFILFIDGVRTPLSGATCPGTAPDFECSAALPALTPGRHVLELSTVDRTTRLESPRSEQLVVNTPAGAATSTARGSAPPLIESVAPEAAQRPRTADSARPSVTCTISSSTCFAISTIGESVGDVRRLVALPDHRLLTLFADGTAQVLPDGERERLAIDPHQGAADVADIAVDHDFLTSHYVYVATVASQTAGRAAISIVRFRELGGRLGEAATIAADLPTAANEPPAISVGPDRRIYLAIPSAAERRDGTAPYDGLVLRLTRDGRAAGYEPAHSPVLAVGSPRPASFAWVDAEHLLLASAAPAPSLAIVPIEAADTFAPTSVPVPGVRLAGGIRQAAAVFGNAGGPPARALLLLGMAPSALYIARVMTEGTTTFAAVDALSLGGWAPITFAVDPGGDVFVAAHQFAGSAVHILHLRRQ